MIELPSIVSWVLQNAVDVLPMRVVNEYQRGVKFKKGVAVRKDYKEGIHWFWPIRERIEIMAVREQVDLLESQSLTTRCNKSVVLRFNIKYSVWSAWRLWVMVHDCYDSLYAEAQGLIAKYVAEADWDTLRFDASGVSSEVSKLLHKKVKKWGFRVHEVNIVELIEAGHYRVFGDSRILPLPQ